MMRMGMIREWISRKREQRKSTTAETADKVLQRVGAA
jgi:hypothetical protein